MYTNNENGRGDALAREITLAAPQQAAPATMRASACNGTCDPRSTAMSVRPATAAGQPKHCIAVAFLESFQPVIHIQYTVCCGKLWQRSQRHPTQYRRLICSIRYRANSSPLWSVALGFNIGAQKWSGWGTLMLIVPSNWSCEQRTGRE